jgi:hypothetical protein
MMACRSYIFVAALLPGFCSPLFGAATGSSFDATVKPFVRDTCAGCHNAKVLSGGLDLERFLAMPGSAALENREVWEKVTDKLKAGAMPPKGIPRPPADKVDAVIRSLEHEYALIEKKRGPDPGRVTARRLNRVEYTNTIRDLLSVNLRVADEFPVDPYGYGFDNNGDVLSLSPVLTEKYLKAAEIIAKAAIPDREPLKLVSARYTSQAIGQGFHLHIQVIHDFPVDGTYVLHTAWEQGFKAGTKFTGRTYLDGKQVVEKPIAIFTEMDRGFETAPLNITQGPHKVETEMVLPEGWKGPKPYPEFLFIRGPMTQAAPETTTSYKTIFICGHAPGHHTAACARRILPALLHRAYRRPVTPAEVEQIASLVDLAQSRGETFEDGMRVAIEAMLLSPKFLFRIESDPGQPAVHRVSGTELASRLSYFLWSSMPDDELLGLAEKGKLRNRAVLMAQVRRMMADPKSRSFVDNFSGQWLETRNLDSLDRDAKMFPEFDAEMRDLMKTETQMFFEAVVKEDRSVLDFLDGKFTFLNERLAKWYGIDGVQGREFRRVALDGKQRAGVLTQASVLTVSSYPTRTSPVIRGKWVLENLLNTPPPPPPPDVPRLDDEGNTATLSLRQRLESHRSNPLCAGCHARMDPLGFGLENYDAVGRWRTSDAAFPIDPSGQLPDGSKFSGPDELRALLLADKKQFVRALSEKMLTYALGRGLEPYDRAAVEKIAADVEKHGYRFSQLIISTVESLPFQMRHESPLAQQRGLETYKAGRHKAS